MSLRKFINTAVTICYISKLKCAKFDFGWGSTPDPAGELIALPGFKGLLAREREGVRDERREMEEERRRGEPGPVLAPSQFDILQKIVPAFLAWLTYPTGAEWGFSAPLGLRPETTIIGSSSALATVQTLDPPLQPCC